MVTDGQYPELEDRLHTWFKQNRTDGLFFTSKTLKYKESAIAKELILTRFQGSKDLKKRVGLRSLTVTSQILYCSEDSKIIEWLSNLKDYIKDHDEFVTSIKNYSKRMVIEPKVLLIVDNNNGTTFIFFKTYSPLII
ncbi:TIGD2.2 family protein [Megaselia abdita]